MARLIPPVFPSIAICAAFTLCSCAGGAQNGFGPSTSDALRALSVGPAKATLKLGGFNETRGGQESLQDPAVSGLKAAIVKAFPGVTFTFSGMLTPTFFSKVNVVLLGVGKSPTSGIRPLSSTEQSALKAFVNGGGAALIFTDNDTFAVNAKKINDSLLAPFGFGATGTINNEQAAPFVQSNDPIANGPFGTATQLDTFYPGWFYKTGTATILASFTVNGKPAVRYLAANGTAGAAVFFSDSSLLFDSDRTQNDLTAILNALALAP